MSSMATPAPPVRIRLERGQLSDVTLAAVLGCVARHPPFAGFSFGLMVDRLREQLRHGACVLAIEDGQLVGYAGWVRVQEASARQWQAGQAEMPPADWGQGGAVIVTVTVVERRPVLVPLLHAISHVCAGLPVYRMRSFQDGRPDMRRPAITGRRYAF